jgi:hypothetical protein
VQYSFSHSPLQCILLALGTFPLHSSVSCIIPSRSYFHAYLSISRAFT